MRTLLANVTTFFLTIQNFLAHCIKIFILFEMSYQKNTRKQVKIGLLKLLSCNCILSLPYLALHVQNSARHDSPLTKCVF